LIRENGNSLETPWFTPAAKQAVDILVINQEDGITPLVQWYARNALFESAFNVPFVFGGGSNVER
jgi:hypothetical protein